MTDPLIPPAQASAAEGPLLLAVAREAGAVRVTRRHRHARGQLLGAARGLLSVDAGGGRWVVQMGEVVNDTTFRIDTASMTSRMKIAMTKTGQFIFTGATGTERTQFVQDSRQLSKSKMFNQKTVARNGTVIAPDLEMLGGIRQRTLVDGAQKQQQLEYEFDFRVVERDTGLEIFQSFIPIEKLGSNQNFAW